MESKFNTDYSRPMELRHFDKGKNANPEENIARIKWNMYQMKYNLIRQKLFLEEIVKNDFFYDGDKTHRIEPYQYVFEEAPNMALSMARFVNYNRNEHDRNILKQPEGYIPQHWYLVTKDYYRSNPFKMWYGIRGEFFALNAGLHLSEEYEPVGGYSDGSEYYINGEANQELYDEYKKKQEEKPIFIERKYRISNYPMRSTLIIVQGNIEKAFSLATICDYSLLFGDVYSELDYQTEINYDNLYKYCQDLCQYYDGGKKVIRKKETMADDTLMIKDLILVKGPFRRYM